MTTDHRSADGEKDPQFAYTLARGFDVLRAFDSASPFLSNREISQRTGIARPTVARLTRTLAIMGYLQYNAQTTRYRLDASILGLGYPLLSQLNIRHIARPAMQQLADLAKGAVSLGMRSGDNMVIVDSCVHHAAPNGKPDAGAVRPITRSALGAAYFCAASADEKSEILESIRATTADTSTAWEDFLTSNEASYATKGYCVSHFETRGIVAIGVPIRSNFDHQIMAFNCATAVFNLAPGDLENKIAPRLMALARSVEMSIGSHH